MKIKIQTKKEVEATFLQVDAGVRYWEDSQVNGEEDENGDLIPFKYDDRWRPVIDIETGKIVDWPQGTTAEIHYKVCDDGEYSLLGPDKKELIKIDGYVPDCLSPGGSGYGDYIIMNIYSNGIIDQWGFNVDEFIKDED